MRPQVTALRRHIEQMMTAGVTITRKGGVTYDDLGTEIPGEVQVYQGKALIRPTARAAQDVTSGQQDVLLTDVDLILPASVPSVARGDLARVDETWGGAAVLVGAKIVVLSIAVDEWAASTLLSCQRVG